MDQQIMERVLLTGDLAGLNPDQRLHYYKSVCESLGLNPLTQPFGYITFEGRLQLYARKDATEQLRKIHSVSITELVAEDRHGAYVVTVKAVDKDGRTDVGTGAVSITTTGNSGTVKNLTGGAMANAIMKAETKAKRRVTLSICGLGLLDESEVEDLDQRPQDERLPIPVIQRNVEQATANASTTGSPAVVITKALENGDLGDTVVHIGKAEGNMLGRKVSELPDEILKWLKEKWIEKLGPSASDQDYKLKKAVIHEIEKRQAAPTTAQEAPEAPPPSQDSTPESTGPTRTAMLDELRGKVEDMVLTPKQFCGYLQLAGLDFQGSKLEELSDGQLTYLLKSWLETQKILQTAMKTEEQPAPKSKPPPKRKAGRKKWKETLL